jgi:branched-chain amino acid transport system permease protein
MNDPIPAAGRWAILAALAALVIVRPAAGPAVLHIAVLALAGLAILPVLGWLRTLWFTPVAAAGIAAWVTALLLHVGQSVPLAALAGTAAGGLVGAAGAVAVQRVGVVVRPWASLLLSIVVWAVLLPRVGAAPAPPPLLFGIDLAGERALGLLALGLVGLGIWVLSNLARARAGRQIGAAGSSPTLALRSGVTMAAVWARAGAVSGVLAGWAGIVLAMDVQSVPGLAQFAPATAVTWLAVPLIGGPMWVSGVLVGALIVGGLPLLAGVPEMAVAGLGLAVAVGATRGEGLVGVVAERFGR